MKLNRKSLIAMVRALAAAALMMADVETWAQQTGAIGAADPDPCVAGQSCFSNVTDILNSRRHLLRTDDFVFALPVG